jgi:excisionase family DNA binding protein
MASHPSTIPPTVPGPLGTLYTTHEVATMLRVSPSAVQKWIYAGMLPAIRYGTALRIREAALVAFGTVVGQPATPTAAAEE